MIMSLLSDMSEMLQKGKSKETAELVQKALDEGMDAQDILNNGLMPGMDVIGERFKNNDIFIPEVLIAARAMAAGTDVLRPLLAASDVKDKGTVVIGTIKDDLHDIGKNLVAMMMESKGLKVINLGNNVPPEKYIEAAIEHNADIIACSALLTTTMVQMKEVVSLLAESSLAGKTKVMIGGAPVNQAYCDTIGAHGFAPDATLAAEKAVALCAELRA
jgi:corrinoid protein of di/trimethylamine methyltransferase